MKLYANGTSEQYVTETGRDGVAVLFGALIVSAVSGWFVMDQPLQTWPLVVMGIGGFGSVIGAVIVSIGRVYAHKVTIQTLDD